MEMTTKSIIDKAQHLVESLEFEEARNLLLTSLSMAEQPEDMVRILDELLAVHRDEHSYRFRKIVDENPNSVAIQLGFARLLPPSSWPISICTRVLGLSTLTEKEDLLARRLRLAICLKTGDTGTIKEDVDALWLAGEKKAAYRCFRKGLTKTIVPLDKLESLPPLESLVIQHCLPQSMKSLITSKIRELRLANEVKYE